MSFTTLVLAGIVAWTGLDESNRIAGRKVSEGYLQGKVVLVDRFGKNCPPCRKLLPEMEKLWQAYKCKPFVLLGGHVKGRGETNEVAALAKEHKLTYPIYQGGGLKDKEPRFNAIPFLYVVDATGEIVYCGHSEKDAEEAVVIAITNLNSPPDVAYWRRLIDFEKDVLPGRALMHIRDLKKTKPGKGGKALLDLAKEYAGLEKELSAKSEIVKLAELENHVRLAKDYDPKNKRAKVKYTSSKVAGLISNGAELKKSEDAAIAQEAKNCLADLKYAELALKAVGK